MKNEWPVRVNQDGNIGVRIGWEPVKAWFRIVNGQPQFLGLTTYAEKPDVMDRMDRIAIIQKAQKQATEYLAIQRRKQTSGKQLRLPL